MKEQKRGNRRTVNCYLLGLEQWLETFQKNSLILIFMELNQPIKQLFSDRDNLYLLVKPTGAKIWRFIYTHPITKKRIKKSFGNYPSILLAFARDKARIFAKLNLSNTTIATKYLIEFQLLTILRVSEAVKIEWSEINWEEKALHIPAERMKGGKRPHSVPLSSQALRILECMREINGHRRFVFTSYITPWNKPMNSQTVNKTLRDLGFTGKLVGHGFRGIASTYLHELDCFSYETVEWCLSHEMRNEVRKAYDKSKKWRSRQEIMQTWGDYI